MEAETRDVDGMLIAVLLHVVDGYLDDLNIFRADGEYVLRPFEPEALGTVIVNREPR